MPRSKIFLPDVNVWLALASRKHAHYVRAAAWMEGVGEQEAAICRVTQMGLLRLLTNRQVMGADAVNLTEAWSVYDRISADPRVHFLSEPPGLEAAWRQATRETGSSSNVWMDAYLQAFASLKELRIVSFDRGFRRFREPEALILE